LFRLLFSICALLVTAIAVARTPVDTIGTAELRPGMKGYGLTVMRGMKPERFDVELIDVLKNFRPNQDLLLIKTPHPRLNATKSVAGMSGSPVYFEGKLAGAYAYGWSFGVEPVAGVTPIASMLAEIDRPIDPEIWKRMGTRPTLLGQKAQKAKKKSKRRAAAARRSARSGTPAGLRAYLGEERHDALWALRAHAKKTVRPAPSEGVPRLLPAATPIMLSGFADTAADLLTDELSRFGLIATQAGGGGGTKASAHPGDRFVDGGAIGVQLIRGDVTATGIGTVTHVADRRLVAFGHPMMNVGQTALPTCTARVLHMLASDRISFKIAEARTPLGALVHDRQAAIVVDTQLEADTVPVTVRIHGVQGAPKTTWNYEVVAQRAMTPMLAFAGMVNAVRATAVDRTEVMFRAETKVKIEGHGTISMTDEGYAGGGVRSPRALAGLRMFSAMDAAMGNPFERARVLGAEVDLHLRFGDEVADILDVTAPYTEVDPGADVELYVTLRRFGHDDEVRPITVHIPRSAAGQKVDIVVQPADLALPEQPKPESLRDILDAIQVGAPATSLAVTTKLPSRGLRMRGHVVHRLPGSVLDTLQVKNSSDKASSFTAYSRKRIPFGHMLDGIAKIQLQVRHEPRR